MTDKQGECAIFEIRVRGQLNSDWKDWFEGMQIRLLEDGEMVLFGPIVDQAALMGTLNKLHRLNLRILSFVEVMNMPHSRLDHNKPRRHQVTK